MIVDGDVAGSVESTWIVWCDENGVVGTQIVRAIRSSLLQVVAAALLCIQPNQTDYISRMIGSWYDAKDVCAVDVAMSSYDIFDLPIIKLMNKK
jgi:hypothetical protein